MTAREEFDADVVKYGGSVCVGKKAPSTIHFPRKALLRHMRAVEREARNAAYERAMQIIDYMKCGANENDHASDIAHDKICDSAIKEIRALKETL